MTDERFAPPRNFAAIPPPLSNFDTSRIVILPVPYDGTMEWHSGAREGPGAIIDASRYLEFFDCELKQEPYRFGIHTFPELECDKSSPENMIDRVCQVTRDIIGKNKISVMLGGEHSLSIGAVKAYREKYSNLSVLSLDAHADLRDSYQGTGYSHACTMRRINEICPSVTAGIRALSIEENEFASKKGLKIFYAHEFNPEKDLSAIVEPLGENVYISIDLDVLDPSVMSAVGTPEPGGLLWQDLLNIVKQVTRSRNVVGFDVMELCPAEGPHACTFLAAKLTYKVIGYLFAKISGLS